MSANPKMLQSSEHDFRMLINGEFVAGASTLEVINPATGKLLTRCARADRAQLDAAVLAAKNAFASWSTTSIESRRQALLKIASAFEARSAEFARLLTEEQGKPLAHAGYEIGGAVAMIRAFTAMDLARESAARERPGTHRSAALAARRGCGHHALEFSADIADDQSGAGTAGGKYRGGQARADHPADHFAVRRALRRDPAAGRVQRDRRSERSGRRCLTQHPDVAKVAFTGSTATGKKVMASVAGTIKRRHPGTRRQRCGHRAR